MIDFTNFTKRKKCYGGVNGKKISIVYNDELYMLKFPVIFKNHIGKSYSNSCFSEYLGCKIFESIGIPVQKTLLGTYNVKGKEKIVVACADFTSFNVILQDFASFKNQIINSKHNNYGTELQDIIDTFEEQIFMESKHLQEHFWNIFIVDALIGNWDRHNENWGFLYNTKTDEIAIAPVYDYGNCLIPQADDKLMKKILTDKNEMGLRIYKNPTSAIKINNKRINYYEFISSLSNEECNKALKRILPKIDLSKITDIINTTPFLSNLQKTFYVTIISERKRKILDYSFELLKKQNIL